MPRKYFDMSNAWSKLEQQKRAEGTEITYEGEQKVQQIKGKTPRVYHESTGFDSTEVRFGDDPAVKIGEHRGKDGEVVEQYQRYDQNGTSRGTYEATWSPDGAGRLVLRGSRRVHGG